ncbi:MAG: murein transglycosylase domain-containing protein [Nitrospira sp.]|jgi:membrane-bound lytic murein transglycosylase C|nr:murein transglycosylase domain-containing protein [Nitrospira sp.]MDH4245064.1 murein transglycosylase domain-containing protein [Nitrospira sp.]MDH4355397.1 murein transglycosylase domain-containing protein [Nitrospira sp.]MDH5320438.1 murein transglycosylase domain-containing protein [Nitrospira sp.]
MRLSKLLVASLILLAGCESLDRTLTNTERVLGSRTGRTVLDLATGKDPKLLVKERVDAYQRDPQAVLRDLRTIQRDFNTIMTALTGRVRQTWGEKEIKVPEQKKYVKYTQNYMSRSVVDFDNGSIVVETLDEKAPKESLKNAIVTTLLTPDDPRSVDLFSDKAVTLTSERPPYLLGLVLDQQGQPIRTPAQAEAFAASTLNSAETRPVDQNGAAKQALVVEIRMVANFSNRQAEKYRATVTKYAEQFKISPSLIFAVIRTESNFNPFAVSSAPAYGLMQLVPSSGGRDAYRKAKGKDTIPSREYLFDPENNIELGSAYLNVLSYNLLEQIDNEVSREYCVISAYNTGSGNVFKTFGNNSVSAVNQINSLEPPAVYDRLRNNLPYQETRDYLVKVVGFRKQFVSLPESNGR